MNQLYMSYSVTVGLAKGRIGTLSKEPCMEKIRKRNYKDSERRLLWFCMFVISVYGVLKTCGGVFS